MIYDEYIAAVSDPNGTAEFYARHSREIKNQHAVREIAKEPEGWILAQASGGQIVAVASSLLENIIDFKFRPGPDGARTMLCVGPIWIETRLRPDEASEFISVCRRISQDPETELDYKNDAEKAVRILHPSPNREWPEYLARTMELIIVEAHEPVMPGGNATVTRIRPAYREKRESNPKCDLELYSRSVDMIYRPGMAWNLVAERLTSIARSDMSSFLPDFVRIWPIVRNAAHAPETIDAAISLIVRTLDRQMQFERAAETFDTESCV